MEPFIVNEDVKCGCCNWRVSRVFLLADSQQEAQDLLGKVRKKGGEALCAECIVDYMMEEGLHVERR